MTVHLQSSLLSLAAGVVVAVLYGVFSEPLFGLFITAALGFIIGYFCLGSTVVLGIVGLLPLVVLAALKLTLGIPANRVEPAWYYFLALVAITYAGFVWLSASEREEENAA